MYSSALQLSIRENVNYCYRESGVECLFGCVTVAALLHRGCVCVCVGR